MRHHMIPGVKPAKTKLGNDKLQKLTQAAEQCFSEKSFYGTSIADICKKAGTAVGTFYIYFDDKIAVYRYLVQNYKYRIKAELAESIKYCTTRLEREREGIKSFIRFACKYPLCYNIIWGSLSVDKKMFEEYYMDFARSYAAALIRDSRALKDVDYLTLSYILMGITNFVGLKFIFEEDFSEKRLDEAVDDTIVKILTEGVFKTESESRPD